MTVAERFKRNLERGDPTVRQDTTGSCQPLATPLEVCLQTYPGPSNEKGGHVIERINSDLEIRQRIPKRIEEDFHGLRLPKSVTWIRLRGPSNEILT